MNAHRLVCAAVRDWQVGTSSADEAVAVALREASDDESVARELLRGAVEWWLYINNFKDVNGEKRRVA